MDRINEILTWLTLTLSWWLYKSKYVDSNNVEPLKISDGLNIVPGGSRPLPASLLHNERLHDDSIISTGLSELMKHRKIRTNLGRRTEDRQVTK